MASQARFGVTPTYEVLEIGGLGHSPIFTVRVRVGGGIESTAQALGKQAAQQAAATEALAQIEALPPVEEGDREPAAATPDAAAALPDTAGDGA
jgi:dsRNA-specific ribonuclease